MPIRVKSNGRNPDIQEAPPIEAEVVEEDEMFATEPSATNLEPEIKCNLRSFIPESSADLEKGFRQLTDDERAEYAIPSDRSVYRVREDAGKNLFNLSSQRVGQHVKDLFKAKPPYPRGYLEDDEGLTDRCMYEIFKKIENTAKRILPGSAKDWRNMKNAEKQFNPRWKTHRFQYLTEHTSRCRDYYNWLDAQPQPSVEVHQAEFMPDEPPEEREDRFSRMRSAIQLAESESDRVLRELLRARREHHIRIATEEILITRKVLSELEPKILADPDITTTPELDEDDDL